MRKAIITAGLLVVFGTTAIAQSPANVEKAKRFRSNQIKSVVGTTGLSLKLDIAKPNNPSKELGSWNIGLENAAQLQELGSNYSLGMDNAAQLQELGTR